MPKRVKKTIRQVDVLVEHKTIALLEQDYELLSLAQALKINDSKEMSRSKKRLKELHDELRFLSNVKIN